MLNLLVIISTITLINCVTSFNRNGTLIYDDLKCKPEIDKNGIITYKCDDLKLSNNSCLYQSKRYNIDENIPQELTYGSCQIGCTCRQQQNNHAGFTCAVLDCPEELTPPLNHSCYSTYTLGKCCATGEICENSENKTEITCEVDGVTYRKGQNFHPKDSCMVCVCLEGFNNTLTQPYCEKINCSTQIQFAEELSKNCAPLYLTDEKFCCPYHWICSNGTENFNNLRNGTPYKCKFGENVVPLGANFKTTHDAWGTIVNSTCECLIPPLLTCYKDKD